jgi:hypothetical protein
LAGTRKKDINNMTKFKDFGTGPDLSNVEPITFALHGETFECKKAVPGKLLLSLVAKSKSEDPAEAAATIGDFFSKVLLSDSYTRFDALLEDPDRIVTVEQLGEITGWIVEQFGDRPEEQPEA